MILMNDFKTEYHHLKPSLKKVIDATLENGLYILGKNVESFETNFAKYVGTKYCIGVANGMEALQISLIALGIGEGDEVITVANTAVATVLAISNVGAKPVFVDVDDFYLMNTDKIKQKISKKTKAIIPVHLFGQMVDMSQLKKITKKYNIKIIEDACQAHGASQTGKQAGSFGDMGCFSFYPTKNLGAYGDGGAITTNSKELYEKCKMLRNYGQKNRYIHELKGLNSRLDEIQAAILKVKLKHLDSFINKRNEIAKIYQENLKDIKQIKLPKTAPGNRHSFHLYVIKAERRDDLLSVLKTKAIQALVHYPIPVHKQNCYKEYNSTHLIKTEETASKILSLPIQPYLTRKEINKVCSAVRSFYA